MLDRGTGDILFFTLAAGFLLLGIGYAALNVKHPARCFYIDFVGRDFNDFIFRNGV